MLDAKRTKRVREEQLSLEEHIDLKRRELINARVNAPQLRVQADTLRQEANAMTHPWQFRKKCDLLRQAGALIEEVEARESMQREHTFEATVVNYLRIYHQETETSPHDASRQTDSIEAYVKHADAMSQRRASILDEYLTEMNQAPAKVTMAVRDVCPRCTEDVKLLLCTSRSIMTCPQCGYAITYLDATSTTTSFDEVIEYSQYSYKRVNHMSMWITLLQGKEVHRVPDEIMNAVMDDLYDRKKFRDVKQITQQCVRESLRRLRLRKAYDHVAQVTARLSGVRPKRIPPETEKQLKNMFLKMQPAFLRHAPKTRTNFLSYGYVLYRCFQILGLHDMLDGITLLKGRSKLEANDAIFRLICKDLNWPIFDLPPIKD